MTKKQLKEYMKYIDACSAAKRKFTRLNVSPAKFWEMIHPAWMLYLLSELSEYGGHPNYWRRWEKEMMNKLGFDYSIVGETGDLIHAKDWRNKKDTERVRKRILKLYPWKKIKDRIMKQYEECRHRGDN